MNDREMLEYAAKAAFTECASLKYPLDWVRDCIGEWNPLVDDGDALRLALNLRISIDISDVCVHADCRNAIGGDIGFFEENTAKQINNGDIFAATRRAIVRAAAEIGKAMEQNNG